MAFNEKVTLKEFYDLIIESLDVKETVYTEKKSGRANKIYPSVVCGPIDIS